MAKTKTTKRKILIDKTPHRKLKNEQHEPNIL